MAMKAISALLGIFVVTLAVKAELDVKAYCPMNCGETAHIMCNAAYPEKWAGTCKYQKLYTLTDGQQKLFMSEHNQRRALLANGKVDGAFKNKIALEMAEMSWDEELAMLAQRNVLSCKMGHDYCSKTKQFPKAGQNAAYGTYSGELLLDYAIKTAVKDWWSEVKDVPSLKTDTDSYTTLNDGAKDDIGHFTQMAKDKAYKIGCAISSSNGKWYIICNYATGNLITDPVYTIGKKAAEKCNKKSTTYPGLCAIGNNYSSYTTLFGKAEETPALKQWKQHKNRIPVADSTEKRPQAPGKHVQLGFVSASVPDSATEKDMADMKKWYDAGNRGKYSMTLSGGKTVVNYEFTDDTYDMKMSSTSTTSTTTSGKPIKLGPHIVTVPEGATDKDIAALQKWFNDKNRGTEYAMKITTPNGSLTKTFIISK